MVYFMAVKLKMDNYENLVKILDADKDGDVDSNDLKIIFSDWKILLGMFLSLALWFAWSYIELGLETGVWNITAFFTIFLIGAAVFTFTYMLRKKGIEVKNLEIKLNKKDKEVEAIKFDMLTMSNLFEIELRENARPTVVPKSP